MAPTKPTESQSTDDSTQQLRVKTIQKINKKTYAGVKNQFSNVQPSVGYRNNAGFVWGQAEDALLRELHPRLGSKIPTPKGRSTINYAYSHLAKDMTDRAKDLGLAHQYTHQQLVARWKQLEPQDLAERAKCKHCTQAASLYQLGDKCPVHGKKNDE